VIAADKIFNETIQVSYIQGLFLRSKTGKS